MIICTLTKCSKVFLISLIVDNLEKSPTIQCVIGLILDFLVKVI